MCPSSKKDRILSKAVQKEKKAILYITVIEMVVKLVPNELKSL